MAPEQRRRVISPFDELHDLGHLGPKCLELIEKLIREEVRRFPALTPASGWQPAELEDMLGAFLTDRLRKVTANLLALAVDEASMGRLIRKSIRYWLIDRARETGIGAVRRALETVLSTEEAFEKVPDGEVGAGRWRLVGSSGPPWSDVVDDLVATARAVPNVRIPRWSSASRRAPMADRKSLVAVAREVLATAGGSLEIAQLVAVYVARFPAVLDPLIVPLPERWESSPGGADGLTPEERLIAAEDEAESAVTAAEIVGMLTPEERRIVCYLDDPLAIRLLLGCGRSQAYQRARRLREKLTQLVGDDDDVRAVGLEVIRLCCVATVSG